MPLIDGEFVDPEFPSEKHLRVIYSTENVIDGVSYPIRYRCLYGGRYGYKDWSYATAAIERMVRCSTRFLFTREVQLTIADSAHQLLKDTIKRLGYSDYFDVFNNKITCKINDSTAVFRGLNEGVSKDLKSMEGIDVCVIGEAENLTEPSFVDLDPTIRRRGSEIWFAFNTKLETGFVYQFCVKNPPPNMICERVNYTDTNAPKKMLSPEIVEQAERMKRDNFELYKNVWLGEPLTIGLFFTELGKHNKETAFIIPEQDDNLRIIGALDHGIAHYTVYHQAWLSPTGTIHGIFSYYRNGGTTKSHAEAIVDAIEACRFSRYMYPSEVYYDYAMEAKHALNEHNYRSDLDEYLDVFKSREGGKKVDFIPANKRKIDGCHAMKLVFSDCDGEPIYKYFDGLNDDLITSCKSVMTDDLNTEIYAKMDGDDGADTLRYLVMGALVKLQSLNLKAKAVEKRPPLSKKEPLTKQFGLS